MINKKYFNHVILSCNMRRGEEAGKKGAKGEKMEGRRSGGERVSKHQ